MIRDLPLTSYFLDFCRHCGENFDDHVNKQCLFDVASFEPILPLEERYRLMEYFFAIGYTRSGYIRRYVEDGTREEKLSLVQAYREWWAGTQEQS